MLIREREKLFFALVSYGVGTQLRLSRVVFIFCFNDSVGLKEVLFSFFLFTIFFLVLICAIALVCLLFKSKSIFFPRVLGGLILVLNTLLTLSTVKKTFVTVLVIAGCVLKRLLVKI